MLPHHDTIITIRARLVLCVINLLHAEVLL